MAVHLLFVSPENRVAALRPTPQNAILQKLQHAAPNLKINGTLDQPSA